MGPNYSISTSCATANYYFFNAANHIRRGDADVMIASGTEAAANAIGVGGFIACRELSQRNDEPHWASRPWDQYRDGFVIGEGSGVLIIVKSTRIWDLFTSMTFGSQMSFNMSILDRLWKAWSMQQSVELI